MKNPLKQGKIFSGYGGGEEMPLGGYALLVGAYVGLLGGAMATLAREGKYRTPVKPADFLLLGGATFHLSRLITRDWVTAPIRAPFVVFESTETAGEVSERSRGRGLRRAVGDLLSCNYCSGPWIALGLATAFSRWPAPTHFVAGIFALSSVSTLLNRAFALAGTAYELGEKRISSTPDKAKRQEPILHS